MRILVRPQRAVVHKQEEAEPEPDLLPWDEDYPEELSGDEIVKIAGWKPVRKKVAVHTYNAIGLLEGKLPQGPKYAGTKYEWMVRVPDWEEQGEGFENIDYRDLPPEVKQRVDPEDYRVWLARGPAYNVYVQDVGNDWYMVIWKQPAKGRSK